MEWLTIHLTINIKKEVDIYFVLNGDWKSGGRFVAAGRQRDSDSSLISRDSKTSIVVGTTEAASDASGMMMTISYDDDMNMISMLL